MDGRWQYVREPVQEQRRLVGEHACSMRPEPYRCQILMVTGREVDEAIHAPPHAANSSSVQVLLQELRRVPPSAACAVVKSPSCPAATSKRASQLGAVGRLLGGRGMHECKPKV
jgi:hypothetical protein